MCITIPHETRGKAACSLLVLIEHFSDVARKRMLE